MKRTILLSILLVSLAITGRFYKIYSDPDVSAQSLQAGTAYCLNSGNWIPVLGSAGGQVGVQPPPGMALYFTFNGSAVAAACDSSGNLITSGGLTGSGTLNTIPKFTPSGSVLGNSSITDNATTVTVGENFTVNGSTLLNASFATSYSLDLRNTGNNAFTQGFSNLCTGITVGSECVSNLIGQTNASANNVSRMVFHYTGAGLATNYIFFDFFGNQWLKVLASGAPQFNNAPAAIGTQNVSGCSLSANVGGSWAGKFTSGTTGTCTVVVTPGITAPNGFSCWANDLTTPANKLNQTAVSNTTATIAGTTTTGDVITWGCTAF